MDPQIEFSLQLTEKDIAGTYEETSTRLRRTCLLPGVVISLAGIVAPCLWPDLFFASAGGAVLMSAVVTTGLLLIYGGTLLVGALRRADVRRFRLSPSALVPTRYQLFDDHLTMISELVHSEIRWPAFLTRREKAGYLYLLLNLSNAFLIPLARLPQSQALEIQEFVRGRVPSLDSRAIRRIAYRRDRSVGA